MRTVLTGFLILVIMGSAINCSDVSAPDNDSSLYPTAAAEADDELTLLSMSGTDVEPSIGIFSITWNHPLRPDGGEPEMTGHIFAIGFDEPVEGDPPFSQAGIDMGSVFFTYPSDRIELLEQETPDGGIVYSNFSRPPGSPVEVIEFTPDASYEFEVTGSDLFSPVTFSLTSPSSLIKITSHSHGDVINRDEDLTITWEGGEADKEVVLHFVPHRPPRRGGPPAPPKFPGGIIITLDSNPGTYTLDASDLQKLLTNPDRDMIMYHVSQISSTEFDHDEGQIRAIMRNGDQVMVHAQ